MGTWLQDRAARGGQKSAKLARGYPPLFGDRGRNEKRPVNIGENGRFLIEVVETVRKNEQTLFRSGPLG